MDKGLAEEGVLEEAEFYNLPDLVALVEVGSYAKKEIWHSKSLFRI